MRWIINRIIMLEVAIRQRIATSSLKKDRSINYNVVYYENDNFREEVYLDEDLKPHFISTQYNGINFSGLGAFVETYADPLQKTQNEIDKIESELLNAKNELKSLNFFEKLTGISIKIERNK